MSLRDARVERQAQLRHLEPDLRSVAEERIETNPAIRA
jgi:hypothetical protein